MAGEPLFNVTGDLSIIQAFKRLERNVGRQIAAPAVRRANERFQAAIAPHVPVRTGKLLKSLKIRSSKGPRDFRKGGVVASAVIIGQSKPTKAQARKGTKIPFYAYMIERGFHLGKKISESGKATRYVASRWSHRHKEVQYVPGKHFVKKVLRAKEAAVMEALLYQLYAGVDRIAEGG